MTRQIIFRGYNLKNQKWLYGYYFVNRGLHFICPEGFANPLASWEDFVVEEESVGEWTGRGNIYEKDIIRMSVSLNSIGIVRWNDEIAAFVVQMKNSSQFYPLCCEYDIIGNIYENEELLEDEE